MIKKITSFLFLLLSIIQSSKKTLSYILSVLLLWFVSAQAISFAQDPIVDPIEIEWRQLNPSKTELLNKGLSAIDLGEYKDANSSIKPNISMDGGGFNYRSQSNSSLITLSPQYSKQTGFAIGGVFAKSITDNTALGVIFNAGPNRNEWLVNAGYDINQNQRVILSLGQLRQNLEFNFESGLEKTQVTQNSGALSYQYLLGKSWLNAAEFNAYISDTPSINLSDKTWYTDTTSLYELWNDPRRIAGAKVEGVQSRLVFTPTTKTTLKLGLGAEHLSYDLSLGKDTYTRATGSAEFNQRLDSGFNLNASANLASSQNRFGLTLSRSFKDGQLLSVDALAIRGRDNTFDDNLITFNFSQTFGGVKSNVAAMNMQDVEIKSASSNASQKDLANNDANPKANWVSNLVNAVAKRPTFLPSQVNAKIDTTASSTRLIAIDKTGMPEGFTIENATGILTVPIRVGGSDVPVSAIAGITKNGSAFTNSGQFALSGSTYLMINPNLITQPVTTDTYIVTMTNVSGGGTTLATITVSHGSTRIDSVVIVSGILTPTITFTIPSKTFGDAAFTLSPISDSGGPFTFASSNTSVATIIDRTVTVIGAGTSTITATQAAYGDYSSATISATLTVTAATPTLSGFALSSNSVVFGAAAPTVTPPTSASSGAITYASSDTSVATISGSTITIVGVGSTTITATQAASGSYTSTTTPTSLTVTASTVATLSNLTIASGTLSPVFASGTISYSASVSNATTSVTVTPTVTNSYSTVKVNGVSVASGVASSAISLSEGANTITTLVTAQDATTTKTYTITVTRAGAAVSVNYLIVAGGGAGGTGVGGGGGAGGLLASSTSLSSGVTYTISVGSGGSKGTPFGGVSARGGNGGDSYISGTGFTTITAIGGGGGGTNSGTTDGGSNPGGSSGGRSDNRAGFIAAATAGQGNIGGESEPGWGGNYGSGGGGGAGAVGSSWNSSGGGAGGVGLPNNITGTTVYYAGGGGGGSFNEGGLGGNGGGGTSTGNSATAYGTDGTGGGGGGSKNNGNNAGVGGKGVVILSIPTASYSGIYTGSPTITTSGSNTILKFTGNGTYTQ